MSSSTRLGSLSELPPIETFQAIKESLIPLHKSPFDGYTTLQLEKLRKTRKKSNHIVWGTLFAQVIAIEKKYNLKNADEATVAKVQPLFQEAIESMVKFGFGVNKDLAGQYSKPLHTAAEEGCQIVAACLIKLGARVNEYSYSGETPLCCAAFYSQTAVVALLIKNGANVRQPSYVMLKDNELPLHVATSPAVIELLVSAGTPVTQLLMDGRISQPYIGLPIVHNRMLFRHC